MSIFRLSTLWTALIFASLIVAGPANAATFVVDRLNDAPTGACTAAPSDCSLRAAVALANATKGPDTIDVTGIQGTIVLTHGELPLLSNITIQGPGPRLLAVSGNNIGRVFYVAQNTTVSLSGMNISAGNSQGTLFPDHGGGIISEGALSLENCTLKSNRSVRGGGGIFQLYGSLTMTGCTVSGNSAHSGYQGGGVMTRYSVLKMTNCTVSENRADSSGGGVYCDQSPTTLESVTIADNTGGVVKGVSSPGTGGGLAVTGPTSLHNTLICGNTAEEWPDIAGYSAFHGNYFTSQGYNLIGNTDGGGSGVWQASDILNKDGHLQPLANYGGSTNTLRLDTDSPAVNAGDPAASSGLTTDQRGPGYPRVHNGRQDIGAFEVQKLVVQSQQVSTIQGTAKAIVLGITGEEGKTLTYAVRSAPSHGTVSNLVANTVTYTPSTGFTGADSFTFNATDGTATSNTATVTVVVNAAGSFVVTTLEDTVDATDGCTSLREAITAANATPGTDNITFGPKILGNIQLSSQLPDITDDVIITGPGASLLTVRRNTTAVYKLLTIGYKKAVQISGLSFANGFINTLGAGALENSGDLTLTLCVFRDNVGYNGGAIGTGTGTFTANRCTFLNNRSTTAGGAIYNGAGPMNFNACTFSGNTSTDGVGGAMRTGIGLTTITNCTFAGNSSIAGGAIYIGSLTDFELENSTVAGNFQAPGVDVPQGGGIAVSPQAKSAHISNSIVAGNDSLDLVGDTTAAAALVTSDGYNLIGTGNATAQFTNHDSIGLAPADLKLGPLQDNGGQVQTMALRTGSPAIDAGNPAFTSPPVYDARGAGYPRIVGSRLDIGAFEVQMLPTAPSWHGVSLNLGTPAEAESAIQ